MHPAARAALATLFGLAAAGAGAQAVSLHGMLGNRALLIVDGSPPRAVPPGESLGGVRVISTAGDQAVVEIDGSRHTLRVGESPASVGARGSGATGGRLVMSVGPGGHFMPQGRINDRAVVFMLDTGASLVSIGRDDAERLDVDLRRAPMVTLNTANGAAPGWRVKLATVQIEDVVVRDVEAVVTSSPMPYVLLGNSFLGRFRMQREGDRMVLDRRW